MVGGLCLDAIMLRFILTFHANNAPRPAVPTTCEKAVKHTDTGVATTIAKSSVTVQATAMTDARATQTSPPVRQAVQDKPFALDIPDHKDRILPRTHNKVTPEHVLSPHTQSEDEISFEIVDI